MKTFTTVFLSIVLMSAVLGDEPNRSRVTQMEQLQSLVTNSPFQSLEFKERMARAGRSGPRQFSFNGYAKISGEWMVALHDNESKETSWVKIGDDFRSHTIKSFNPKKQNLVLTRNGNEITINLDTGR